MMTQTAVTLLFSTSASGGGVAFFAHVGGFLFGMLAAWLLARTGRITARQHQRPPTAL
jgi:membrane associated rhomboid family serine protease